MEIVINAKYGAYGLSNRAIRAMIDANEIVETNGVTFLRTSPTLIHFIKTYGSKAASGPNAYLQIVNIPNNATDWRLNEYDGLESILYVLDGKIHEIFYEEDDV